MNVKKINNRIKLMTDKTDKFKTFTLSFFFHRELNRENSSLNALVPYVLKQGSKNYPDMKIISETLEELYGSEFDCSVRKKGNDQILGFHFQFVSPQYIKDSNYINEALRFPFDIIFTFLSSLFSYTCL